MVRSGGYRSNTRDLFQQPFRKRGPVHLSTYLTTYKIGDYVDIRANPSIHKGMPHKYYHGKTGRVWNVTPRAIGVQINKPVGNRIIPKRIHVRVEHLKPSKCRIHFLERLQQNQAYKKLVAEKKAPAKSLKRDPGTPLPAKFVKGSVSKNIAPAPYEFTV